jgi:hypothetical protein
MWWCLCAGDGVSGGLGVCVPARLRLGEGMVIGLEGVWEIVGGGRTCGTEGAKLGRESSSARLMGLSGGFELGSGGSVSKVLSLNW